MVLKVGDKFPEGVEFSYIPIDYSSAIYDPLVCSRPIKLNVDKFIKESDGCTLIVSVPGAFTPTCTENHIPPILANLKALKQTQKINRVLIISANDAFVLNSWGKLLVKELNVDVEGSSVKLHFASDGNATFAQKNGLSVDASANGMGIRTSRFALVVDATGTVKYIGRESKPGVTSSGYEQIIRAKL